MTAPSSPSTRTAGRALDALIYTSVMGNQFSGDSAGKPFLHIPHYSTDIAAAVLVVEKMRADGYHFDFGSRRAVEADTWWYAKFWRIGQSRRAKVQQAAPPPLWICLAALSAVEGA